MRRTEALANRALYGVVKPPVQVQSHFAAAGGCSLGRRRLCCWLALFAFARGFALLWRCCVLISSPTPMILAVPVRRRIMFVSVGMNSGLLLHGMDVEGLTTRPHTVQPHAVRVFLPREGDIRSHEMNPDVGVGQEVPQGLVEDGELINLVLWTCAIAPGTHGPCDSVVSTIPLPALHTPRRRHAQHGRT